MQAAYNAILTELAHAKEEAAQARADREWWMNIAFELNEEVQELRRQLNSVGVYAQSTRGR